MTEVSDSEFQKAEAKLTPIQRVMTNARDEVLSHEDDWIKAGGSKEQVENASAIASDRVKAEFETREKEDPIRTFVSALHEAATTDEEKVMADAMEQRMEQERAILVKIVRDEKTKAKMRGEKDFDLVSVLRGRYANNSLGLPAEGHIGEPVEIAFSLLDTWVPNPNSTEAGKNRVELTPEYQTKVLRQIGSLEKDQNVADLRFLPGPTGMTQDRNPFFIGDGWDRYADNLPTNIPEARAKVNFKNNWVSLKISDPKVLERIASFPASN